MSIVVAFASQALAKELASDHTSKSQNCMDELVGRLVDQGLQGWPLHDPDVDRRTLAMINPCISHGTLGTRPLFSHQPLFYPFPVLHPPLPVSRSLPIPRARGPDPLDSLTEAAAKAAAAAAAKAAGQKLFEQAEKDAAKVAGGITLASRFMKAAAGMKAAAKAATGLARAGGQATKAVTVGGAAAAGALLKGVEGMERRKRRRRFQKRLQKLFFLTFLVLVSSAVLFHLNSGWVIANSPVAYKKMLVMTDKNIAIVAALFKSQLSLLSSTLQSAPASLNRAISSTSSLLSSVR